MALVVPLDRFQQLQHAVAGYVLNIPFFNGVAVFLSQPQVQPDGTVVDSPSIQTAIESSLSGITSRNGMTGVAMIVYPPAFANYEHNAVNPQQVVEVKIRTIENVLFNFATGGTFIAATAYVDAMFNALHKWSPGQQWGTYALMGKEGRQAVPVFDYERGTTIVIYESTFFVYWTGITAQRVFTPVITISGSTCTITCVTAGAPIYYTVDGTFPGPSNSRATLYTAPFAVTNGQLIKAVAFPPS